MRSSLAELGRDLSELGPAVLGAAVLGRLEDILLDTFGCAVAGAQLDPYPDLTPGANRAAGESLVWLRSVRTDASEAALVNGTVTHHVEMDDGQADASFHGGVSIVPAALAVAEAAGASGRELLVAIACGYGAALACGAALREGIEAHRLHPPSQLGAFGAAASAARLMRLSGERTAGALALAGTLAPVGPFESFTKGASVKDLYGGWPALVGVRAARLAAAGFAGPLELFDSEADGLGRFLSHAGVQPRALDVERALDVYFKPFASCRATHSALTALETLLPLPAERIARVRVETYAFAAELSADADPSTSIGAKTSIPFTAATLLLDGRVDPDAFGAGPLLHPRRRELASRVQVETADLGARRASRVTVTLDDGSERAGEAAAPRDERDVRAKLRRLAGPRAGALEAAVDGLGVSNDLSRLLGALEGPV